MVSFDGAPGYQHHCPELGKGLLQTLVILPVSDREQQYREFALDHRYQY